MRVDEVAYGHVAGRSARALAVHVGDHVGRAADVVVADDTAAQSHAAVRRRRHEHDRARTTAGVERLVKTEVRPRRRWAQHNTYQPTCTAEFADGHGAGWTSSREWLSTRA